MDRQEANWNMWNRVYDRLNEDLADNCQVNTLDLETVWVASFTNNRQSKWWRSRVRMVSSFVSECRETDDLLVSMDSDEKAEIESLFVTIEESYAAKQDSDNARA